MKLHPTGIVVVGAGGFAREALDVIAAVNACGDAQFRVLGAIDADVTPESRRQLAKLGVELLGSDDAWLASASPVDFVVGIGDPGIRAKVAARYEQHGHRPATLVHPRAVIGSLSAIGAGSVVCGGVQLSTNVRLGRHVHVNPNATIGHDAELSDFVSINPGAVISGGVVIEPRVLVGAGAVVLEQLRIGASARVGAAACVVREVQPGTTVKGVPAR